MARQRLLTRWICVCIALPASIVLFFFQLLHPWEIQEGVSISFKSKGLTTTWPKFPSFNVEDSKNTAQTGKEPTRALILPIEAGDELQWIPPHFKRSDHFSIVSYVLNDRHSPNALPSSKGGPVMVFLSYILQHYELQPQLGAELSDTMADVNIFMKGKQLASYNDGMLTDDASKMLVRLRAEYVLKEGFVNLMCEREAMNTTEASGQGDCEQLDLHNPRPRSTAENIVDAWHALFPGSSLPRRLSLLPGGQLAASKRAIRKVSRATWVRLQQWLIETDLGDEQASDVLAALWQLIFTDQAEGCPEPRECYCGLYAVCFADVDEFAEYLSLNTQYAELEPAYDGILRAHHRLERSRERHKDKLVSWLKGDVDHSDSEIDPWNTDGGLMIRKQIGEVSQSMWRLRNQALRRGDELHPAS